MAIPLWLAWGAAIIGLIGLAVGSLTFVPLIGDWLGKITGRGKLDPKLVALGLIVFAVIGFGGIGTVLNALQTGSLAGDGEKNMLDSDVVLSSITVDYTGTWNSTTATHCNVGTDTSKKNKIFARCHDAGISETAGQNELNFTLTVERSSVKTADSCEVKARTSPFFNMNDTSDSTEYKLWEQNSLREGALFLDDSAVATTSDQREKTSLAFAEGTKTSTLSGYLDLDEEATDGIDPFSTKSIYLDFCDGTEFEIQFTKQ